MFISGIVSFTLSVLVFNFGFFSPEVNEHLATEKILEQEKGIVKGVAVKADTISKNNFSGFYLNGNLPKSRQIIENNVPDSPKLKAEADPIDIDSVQAAVLDGESGDFIYQKKSEQKAPIASITKLMSALVFLDTKPDWDAYYQIKEEDRRNGGRIYLFLGEKLKIKDLFYTSLVASGNTATQALVNSTGLTEQEFVEKMNRKARILKLRHTNFDDPVGLSDKSISTPKDVARLVQIALSNKRIKEATLTKNYSYQTQGGREKNLKTTDQLLENFSALEFQIIGGKTGYLEEAGYCFVSGFKNKQDKEIYTAILGADSKESRFTETKDLVSWVYSNFYWDN